MFWNLFKKKKKEDSNKQIESHGMIHKIEKPWKCRICNEIYTEDYTAGLCKSWWEKEFAIKKNFYSAYKKKLELFLQEYGIKTNNKTKREEYLTRRLKGALPNETGFHNLLVDYPWRRIYTVNIDDLVENIYEAY